MGDGTAIGTLRPTERLKSMVIALKPKLKMAIFNRVPVRCRNPTSKINCPNSSRIELFSYVINILWILQFYFVSVICQYLFVLFFYFIPIGLWITALSRFECIAAPGLRLRKVPPSTIVNAMITATKASFAVERDYELALAGGNVSKVINALISQTRQILSYPLMMPQLLILRS